MLSIESPCARRLAIAPSLLHRFPAHVVRRGKIVLKIIVLSLNPQPSPSPARIFNAHSLDFLNANFDGPEMYCFAAYTASNIMEKEVAKS
jgi:hypothetical protein